MKAKIKKRAPLFFLSGLFLLLTCVPPKPYEFKNFSLQENALTDLRDKRIAVLPFESPYGIEIGKKAAEEMSLQIGKIGKFDIVERERIEELWQEQDLDKKRIDENTTVEIGKMFGAHGVVFGTIREYKRNKVGLAVRLVSVETGRIIWQASDVIKGSDRRIQVHFKEKEDKIRLTEDPDFLLSFLCQLFAQTWK
ncbi:MAG: CsgG/HfaB family protein [candidate division WOR-3 bacterium]